MQHAQPALACRVHKGGAVFDQAKLTWMNGHYLRDLPDDELVSLMAREWTQSGVAVCWQALHQTCSLWRHCRLIAPHAAESLHFAAQPALLITLHSCSEAAMP